MLDTTATVGVLVVVAFLQSHVKAERSKDGTWTFRVEKRPMSSALLERIVGVLCGRREG